jgi:hypothetical protein
MRLCLAIIAGGRRVSLVDRIIEDAKNQGWTKNEIIVAGMHHEGIGFRYLEIPGMTHSTTDALVKRDAATVATRADTICYLSDDHTLDPNFLAALRFKYYWDDFDVLIPARYTVRDDEKVWLNSGAREGYCSGHGGVFRRWVIEDCPWSAGPHHRLWDLLTSQWHQTKGYKYVAAEPDLAIVDIEGGTPWIGCKDCKLEPNGTSTCTRVCWKLP